LAKSTKSPSRKQSSLWKKPSRFIQENKMTYSEYKKTYKQLKNKKAKWKKFVKHNSPKQESMASPQKVLCLRKNRAYIQKYTLNQCRQCFRENARSLGFKKYK